ncbi:hypothetical protein [Corynebacterium bovis]|uniref:hypothetical protein n=1 Tax=Corynebacterium bovis TaxID=36808 RepID=UPI003138E83D
MTRQDRFEQESVVSRIRIPTGVYRELEAARVRLGEVAAETTMTEMYRAAVRHYLDYLAVEINGGRPFVDAAVSQDKADRVVRTRSGKRPRFIPVADWALVPSKRKPEWIGLALWTGGEAIDVVAEIRPARMPNRRDVGWTRMVNRAGYVVDHDREEVRRADGSYLVPIKRAG